MAESIQEQEIGQMGPGRERCIEKKTWSWHLKPGGGVGGAEELGAWLWGMERWDFMLKVVITGAERLSWGWSSQGGERDTGHSGVCEEEP